MRLSVHISSSTHIGRPSDDLRQLSRPLAGRTDTLPLVSSTCARDGTLPPCKQRAPAPRHGSAHTPVMLHPAHSTSVAAPLGGRSRAALVSLEHRSSSEHGSGAFCALRATGTDPGTKSIHQHIHSVMPAPFHTRGGPVAKPLCARRVLHAACMRLTRRHGRRCHQLFRRRCPSPLPRNAKRTWAPPTKLLAAFNREPEVCTDACAFGARAREL